MFAKGLLTKVKQVGKWNNNVIRSFANTGTFLDKSVVSDRVFSVLSNFEKVEEAKLQKENNFTKDMGLDSLDVVEVVMAMEEEFVIEIPDNEAEKLTTPSQVIEYIAAHPMAK